MRALSSYLVSIGPRGRVVVIVLAAVFLSRQAYAQTTYYISPAGKNSHDCRTARASSTPKRTFSSAWECLSAGDTLVAKSGVYSEDLSPPEGKAGTNTNPIVVRAESDGSATVNGRAILIANSYLTFEGFRMKGPAGDAVLAIGSNDSSGSASHHITLRRMGLECPLTGPMENNSACVGIGSGAHDNLLEDCWVWGGGRYTVMLYGRDSHGGSSVTGADNNVLRRLVLRMGPNVSGGGEPQAALSLYYASNNTVENVLVVDSQPNSASSNSAFYVTGHSPPPRVSGNRFYGVIALNTTGREAPGFYLDVDKGGISSHTEIRDSVFWANAGGGVAVYNSNPGNNTDMIISHVTSGQNGSHGYENYTDGVSVRSSVFYSNGGYGMKNGSRGSTSEDFNLVFGNKSGDRNNVAAGANGIARDPRLSFILRTEAGTPCRESGKKNTDCGAEVLFRYGEDGTRFGEAGYDRLTDVPLWPWPNESRILLEMCPQGSSKRGFCGARSLTAYVWEYLKNPMPFPR